MGSIYQSKHYFKGGKRTRKGGFYPSVMGGVVGSGKYLLPIALRQGYQLLNKKNKTRKSKKNLRKKHK